MAKGGTGSLKVDGVEVATQKFPNTVPITFESSETFDIGSDTGTGVADTDYQPPFAFTGKLNKVTIDLSPAVLSAADQQDVKDKAIKRD